MLLSYSAIAEQGITVEGTMDCGQWVESRSLNRSIAYEHYLIGLINGQALGRQVEFWNAGGIPVSLEQVHLWMDKYCKDHPLSNPIRGTYILFEEKLQSPRYKENVMKAVILARVSTKEQEDGHSLKAQLVNCIFMQNTKIWKL